MMQAGGEIKKMNSISHEKGGVAYENVAGTIGEPTLKKKSISSK